MTAATYTTNLSDIFTDGSTTGWTAIGGGASGLNQETDYYIQGTSCLSKNAFASALKGMIYSHGSDAGGSGTDGAYLMWVTHLTPNSLATIASGGIQFIIGSSTSDYVHYYVGGSDTIEFGGWVLAAVNEATAGDTTDTGTPSATVESYFGALWNLPSGGPTKGAPNGIDAIRYGRCDAIIEFGTGADPDATFTGLVSTLDSVTNRYGLFSFINGVYYNSGLVQFGSSTNAVNFTDSNKTILLRDHPHVTSNFHTWEVQNASSVINFTNLVVRALGTASRGRWVTTDNATVNMTNCSFTDMGTFSFLTNATIDTCTFRRCNAITHGGAVMNNSVVEDTNVSANASALIYNINADPDGEMDGMSFTMGTTLTHAIEFGTTSPLTMTLRNIAFSGYNSGNNVNDSTLHIKRTSGTVTINLVGCTGNISYRTDAATVALVSNPVTATVHVEDISGTNISGARVLLKAADGTGPLSYNASVSITQSAGTATVSHTSHPYSTNDYVVIEGCNEEGYNKVAQITVTGANSYTYSVNSGLSSPATGSPVATGVMVYGTTNASGDVTGSRSLASVQPVTGWVRKASSAPYYKTSPISGTVDNSVDTDFNIILISDE